MSGETTAQSRPSAYSPACRRPPGLWRKEAGGQRVTIDRLLSKLGLASRSRAQAWIRAGRVTINERIIGAPGTWVSWPRDRVAPDGHPIEERLKRFVLFHKPKGLVTTHDDEKGRRTVFDVLPPECRALHTVGRLDQATSGLLLLTNDSMLSNFLADPCNRVCRRYLVTVRGMVTEETRAAALDGLIDQGERLQCDSMTVRKGSRRESHLDVTLTEGKNREIRRLFKALGHEVTRLRRIQYGPFMLGDLPAGACRELPIEEAKALLDHQMTRGDHTVPRFVSRSLGQ